MEEPESQSNQPQMDLLSENLFRVVTLILLFVGALLIVGLAIQTYSYFGGLHAATTVGTLAPNGEPIKDLVDHAAVITYARGLGAAFVKTSALFLGFILIFTGTLYVLRTAEANFDLRVAGGTTQGSLQTSSPGLVIVTLGVLLTALTITTKSDLGYEKTVEPASPPVSVEAIGDAPKAGAWSDAPPAPGGLDTPAGEGSH